MYVIDIFWYMLKKVMTEKNIHVDSDYFCSSLHATNLFMEFMTGWKHILTDPVLQKRFPPTAFKSSGSSVNWYFLSGAVLVSGGPQSLGNAAWWFKGVLFVEGGSLQQKKHKLDQTTKYWWDISIFWRSIAVRRAGSAGHSPRHKMTWSPEYLRMYLRLTG